MCLFACCVVGVQCSIEALSHLILLLQPAQVGLSQILHPDAVVRPPALPPRPHMVDNRDKIKQWITDQGILNNYLSTVAVLCCMWQL